MGTAEPTELECALRDALARLDPATRNAFTAALALMTDIIDHRASHMASLAEAASAAQGAAMHEALRETVHETLREFRAGMLAIVRGEAAGPDEPTGPLN